MRRHVSIHLTPFVHDVGSEAIGDRRRWLTLWSVSPAQAAATLCERLAVAPGSLTVCAHAGGDIEVLGPSPKASGQVLLALVNFGLDVPELQACLERLGQGRRVAA